MRRGLRISLVGLAAAAVLTSGAGSAAATASPKSAKRSADVAITMTGSPSTVQVGESVTYTISVANRGPGQATSVVLEDILPVEVAWRSTSTTQGSCGGMTLVRCELGVLANGSSATVTIGVETTSAGTVTNTATVSAAERDAWAENNTASATTSVYRTDRATTKLHAEEPRPSVEPYIDPSCDLRCFHEYSLNEGTMLTARLLDSRGDQPLQGRRVDFYRIDKSAGTVNGTSCTGWTASDGRASCLFSLIFAAESLVTYHVVFRGDETHAPSEDRYVAGRTS